MRCLYFFVLLFTVNLSFANFQSDIQQIIQHTDKNLNIGIAVVDLTKNKPLLSINANRGFIPASNLKLYTAIAALHAMQPNFQFKTQFMTSAKIIGGALMGDLYLKMVGAPDFTSKQLLQLVKQLKDAGIQRILGRVYIDNLALDEVALGPGWMWDDAQHCFAAPVGAIVLNHNCVGVRILDNKNLKLGNVPLGIKITSRDLSYRKNKAHCQLHIKANDDNHYQLSGCLADKSSSLSLSLKNPRDYLTQHLLADFKQETIFYNHPILPKLTPINAHAIATIESVPLRKLVTHMLKKSDNLYADNIFKSLGHLETHEPGSWQNARATRNKILSTAYGLPLKNNALVDGSGLSQYNLVTPQLTVALLTQAYHDSHIALDVMAALPISGYDGTLKHRLNQESIRYKVRAKTGSLSHISSLSGYIDGRQHHTLAFSIFINGAHGRIQKYRKLEDEIVIQLSQLG